MDRTEEALQLYLSAIEQSDEDMRVFYVIGYEGLAVPYIKKCIEAGATKKVYSNAQIGAKYFPANDGKTNVQRYGKHWVDTGNRRIGLCAARFFLAYQHKGVKLAWMR